MVAEIQQAEAAQLKGNFTEAESLYSAILSTQPAHIDALYGLATLYTQQNQLTKALAHFVQLVQLEPEAADIAYNHAICLEKAGTNTKALTEALRALKLATGDEHFCTTICKLLLKLHQPQPVIQYYAKLPPVSIAAKILRAQAFGTIGEWDVAVAELRKLCHAAPQNPAIFKELALAAGKLRDYDLAISSYGHYLTLVTPSAEHYLRYADLYLIARDPLNCQKYLNKAAALGSPGAEHLVIQARLDRLQGNYPRASKNSLATLELKPDHGQAWNTLVETAEKDWTEELLTAIQQLDLSHTSPYYKILITYAKGDLLEKAGQFSEAFTAWHEANILQQAYLQSAGLQYDPQTYARQTSNIQQQFSAISNTSQPGSNNPTPLFIVGMPRSGTTLVEKILAQLEPVTAGGENEALNFIATQYQRDVNNHKLPIPASMTPAQWQTLANTYFSRTNISGQYITDKMPHNFNHVGMILEMFPHAKVIQMHRDPRDICLSIYKRAFPDGHTYACNLESLAHAFILSQQLMNHWTTLNSGRVLDIQYENLVSKPEEVTRELLSFCGLDWNPACLDFHNNITSSFTFSEMQVREKINKGRIGNWQAYEEQLTPLICELSRSGCLPYP